MHDSRNNLTFSPMCMATALAMTWVGAKEETAKQIWDVLELGVVGEEDDVHQAFNDVLQQLSKNNDGTYGPPKGPSKSGGRRHNAGTSPSSSLHIANRLYVDESYQVIDEFSATLSRKYLADVGRLDFTGNLDKCRRDINKWVEDATENNVRDLVRKGSLGPDTRLVLVNAIHFRGSWVPRFHSDKVHTGSFYQKKFENAHNITMMEIRGAYPFAVDYDFKCKVVELPYLGSSQNLIMFLPLDVDGLPAFENKLTPEMIKFMKKSMTKTKLTVTLPRISYHQTSAMSPMLKRMGIEDLFYADRADLSGITGSRDLHFFEFVHSVFMDATDGNRLATPTLASGKTAVTRASRAHEMTFTADHPFFFLIYDRPSKLILFMGRFTDPHAQSFFREQDEALTSSSIQVKVEEY